MSQIALDAEEFLNRPKIGGKKLRLGLVSLPKAGVRRVGEQRRGVFEISMPVNPITFTPEYLEVGTELVLLLLARRGR